MVKIKNKVSMQDIAERIGISKNAVSLALNGKPGVSEETRQLVIQLAQRLNYAGFSDSSQNKRVNNILVLIPEYIKNDSYFYNEIYWSIENEARNKGYNAIMTSIPQDMEESNELPSIYFDMEYIGAILVGVFHKNYVERLIETGILILSVDNYYDGIALDAVVTANIEGAYKIVKYLIGFGHKKIGFIGSIGVTSSIFERWTGYQKAMLEADLQIDNSYLILDSTSRSDLWTDIQKLEEKISKLNTYPTAWVCGGDRIAIALIGVLNRRGIKVPEDISVAGFDDIEAASIVVPHLTTMRVKRKEMGKIAVEYMVKHSIKEHEKRKISLYTDLIIRESIKDIRK